MKAQALSNARKEALRKLLGYPEGFDMDANREAVIQEYQRIHRTRNWTDHNGTPLTLRSTARCTYLQFERPWAEKKKAPPRPKAGEGTATEDDAIEHLRPFLGKKLSEVGFRYLGDDKAIEAELNKFLQDNGDVLFERLLGYGGDACSRDFRAFVRTFKVINKPGPGRKTGGVPDEALVVFCDKQRTPVLVPKTSYNIKNPRNPKTKKAIVNSSLWFVLDSVDAEDELRKRPCHVERLCHLMEEKDKVVMAEPFRGRALRPSKDYAFCTQASTALAPVSRGPLYPGDKVECWVGLHAAKYFRAPTEDEHAAFVASKDREKKTRKLHDADKKRGSKQKKHKAMTATGALE